MMFSQRSSEGYVLIDNKESPGLTEEQAIAAGRGSLMPFVGKGQRFEAATNTCSHCDKIVVQNPNRTRPRGHCSSCDRFICDSCQAEMYLGGDCQCRQKRIDAYFDKLKETMYGT